MAEVAVMLKGKVENPIYVYPRIEQMEVKFKHEVTFAMQYRLKAAKHFEMKIRLTLLNQ